MPDSVKRDETMPAAAGESKTREVFYRKYRFSSFSNMCGQQQVASFFINTIKYNKVSHAYLFSGPRGTGKTSMARLFAKILNCSEKTSYEPCGKCHNCVEFERGSAVDIIEMDAASNRKIDDIRSLRDDVAFMPINGKYKIFILDEAHMLTTEAANAFLKTLEEPPPYVIFILATTEHHKIPATILSRCQLVKFTRIATADIVKRLEFVVNEENAERNESQKIACERPALFLIAKKANGGMRDALSLLEYVIALSAGGKITSELVEQILGIHSTGQIKNFVESICSKNAEAGLEIINKIYEGGSELLSFIENLNSYLSTLTLIKIGVSASSS
ncbi:MAG TPA: DNA polymerase III subunit gamma/tau, partial [Candidatus Wallbacteria bacterium]|nr:DNA polymerase III subunit gamma/tau [Candidatus Wallbacteria bacterium]